MYESYIDTRYMNSPVNINEIYKNEEKGKYVIKSFGRWRHQSQFTTTETRNMSDTSMNDKR